MTCKGAFFGSCLRLKFVGRAGRGTLFPWISRCFCLVTPCKFRGYQGKFLEGQWWQPVFGAKHPIKKNPAGLRKMKSTIPIHPVYPNRKDSCPSFCHPYHWDLVKTSRIKGSKNEKSTFLLVKSFTPKGIYWLDI